METPVPRGWKGSSEPFDVIRTLDGHIQPFLRIDERSTDEQTDVRNPHEVQ